MKCWHFISGTSGTQIEIKTLPTNAVFTLCKGRAIVHTEAMWQIVCDCLVRTLTRRKCRLRSILAALMLSAILYLIVDVLNVTRVGKKQRKHRIHQYFINVSRTAKDEKYLYVGNRKYESDHVTCSLPEVPLWSPEVRNYVKKPSQIQCNGEADWVYTQNGKFFISSEAVNYHGRIHCVYIPIVNVNDSFKELNPVVPMLNGSHLLSDAFKVSCKAADRKRYSNIHACIAPIYTQNIPEAKSDKFNIFIFGFDSISRNMFKRLLPKTHAYFTESLGGKILEGYNIIGDGTPQALMPILTGKQETEIPEVRRGKPGARHVDDVLEFFWTKCERKGYVTQWGEDMAHVGTFNLRMLGFRRQPVHHYMRPFYLAAIPMFPYFRKNCLGSKPRYKVFLDWLMEGLVSNKRKNFLTFGFFSELSHDNNNPIALMDDENVKFLASIQDQGILDNTVFIMMSDHGIRYGPLRSTEQGKLEERLPYFGFRFPKKFNQMFPEKMKTFETNTKRLVTPFDVYETLLDIIDEQDGRKEVGKGISLLKEIPRNRTCAEAGIEPHWCACLKQTRVSESDFDISMSVNAILTTMNKMLEPFTSACYKLSLQSVIKAIKLETNDKVLKFRRTLDEDGRILDMNDTLVSKEVIYQVTFITNPNNGVFEATVRMESETGNCKVNTKDISRINKYGYDPWCILNMAPNLRPYCLCKKNKTDTVSHSPYLG